MMHQCEKVGQGIITSQPQTSKYEVSTKLSIEGDK